MTWTGHGEVIRTCSLLAAGGDEKYIVRWRPSVRHDLFDDDHVVWTPYGTKHVRLIDRNIFVYTRVKRTLHYFKDVDPHDWCDLNK